MAGAVGPAPRGARLRLGFASAGVLLGAADTYVVVIALPAIMSSVGVDLAHLQQATPIISGFLVGYVAVLPLLGRLSDLYGRSPVLMGCLLLFAGGSLLTASANTLGAVVVGRALQGAGGGGLVPVTLALVADLWPAQRRGVPLGVVGAVQEFGSVVGPLYGALLTAASTWRAIFYVNMPLAALIAAGIRAPRQPNTGTSRLRADTLGRVLALLCAAATVLAVAAPPALADNVTVGTAFTPLLSSISPSSPIALVALISALAFVARELTVGATVRPMLPLRDLRAGLRQVDWLGAVLVALVLGCIIVAFASADPQRGVVGDSAPVVLPAAAILAALFVVRELHTAQPLVDLRALRDRAAAGSLITNLAVGAALMAALVDIPVFARATVDPDSQVAAALVLARLLVAVPVGAVLGGLLVGRAGYRLVAGAGMLLTALMFVLMSGWSATALADSLAGVKWLHATDLVLVGCGLGFGLSIVPVTAAILGAVPQRLHGVAASLTVAARMVGMLAGLSLLTAIGLHRFYSVQAMLPDPARLCPTSPLNCAAYNTLATGAAVDELHVIFIGAAVCALIAAVTAAALLRRGSTGVTGILGVGVA
ncbi:MAG: MFS transporter [Candidatus Dormibacteraeota bacterium]|nr:MFS transporter [Candidatus Dormibacteraeota bacterium]